MRIAGLLCLGTVFLGFSAAAQVEAPAAPAAPGAVRPAPIPAGPPGLGQPFGPFAPGGVPVPAGPDSAARAAAGGFPFALVGPTPPGVPTPGWIVTPSLGVTQSFNDNVFFTPDNRTSDFITNVNAGLSVAVETARLQGSLNTTLGYNFHANQTREDGATVNGGARFLLTLVPDMLFVSASGSATTQPFGATFNPQAQTDTAAGNLITTYSFQLSPYAVQRFGGIATGFAGYVFQFVDQGEVGRRQPREATTIEELLLEQARSVSATFSSHQVYAGARTGEDFGRLAAQGTVSGTWFEGDGLYQGAYRNLALLETRYAFLPTIAGLIEIGFERERFNTVPRTDVEGPVWAVGARLVPNPDSLIIIKYGRRNGFDSWRVNGNWAVGVRTTIAGTYQETLTTAALSAADLLATTTIDALGNPVDTQTGAPVLPGLASQVLGAPGVIVKQRLGTASISQSWPRDTIALTATFLESVPFAADATAPQQRVAIETTSIGLRWTRALAPVTSLSLFGSYAMSTTTLQGAPGGAAGGAPGGAVAGGSTDVNSINAGATLVTALTETIGAAFTYQLNWRDNALVPGVRGGTASAVQNIFTAGLRKSF